MQRTPTVPCMVCSSPITFPAAVCNLNHVQSRRFLLPGYSESAAARAACQAADLLVERVMALQSSEDYRVATALHASSGKIQELLSPTLLQLGFQTEQRVNHYPSGFRPDFEREVEGESILVEIERGKTTDNNMDMLDMWKTHIHPSARHLILVVPVWYVTTRATKKTFSTVTRRLEPFFRPENATNVDTLNLIGF